MNETVYDTDTCPSNNSIYVAAVHAGLIDRSSSLYNAYADTDAQETTINAFIQ